jgi:hypothetical protein
VTAAVRNAEGDRSGAATSLREAASLAEAADMALYAAAARHQLALSLGKSGTDLRSHADDAMLAQGIRAPARFASMLAPGVWGVDR